MRIWRPSIAGFEVVLVATIAIGAAVIGEVATPWGAWLGLFPIVVGGWWILRRPLRRWWIAHTPFPSDWHDWLTAHLPFYSRLGDTARRRYERDVQFFMNEQRFEAVGGVEVTDELRLSVAAGAALLLHGRHDWEWPTTRTILFYPNRFDDTYHESDFANFDGMIHAQGPIIFSKKAVEESWGRPGDGDNVVLHELAHVFDFKQMEVAGLPSFLDAGSEKAWKEIVRREMQHAQEGRSLLRPYAGTNPAEFFAVAVENFFERPEALYEQHAELYRALSAFFQLDLREEAGRRVNGSAGRSSGAP